MKTVEIKIIKFETKDGKMFDDESVAKIHEDILDGVKKICPNCDGLKTLMTWDDDYRSQWSEVCGYCDGKGYLEKQIIWK